MGNITGFFEELRKNYQSLENSLKTITNAYDKTIHFFEVFFYWIPPEVILLLLLSIVLLILINNLSPSTPRANLTFSVIILCLVWGYLNQSITGEIKFFWIFKTSLKILLPVYFFSIFSFLLQRLFLLLKKRKKVSASNIEDYLLKIETNYHLTIATSHSYIAGESNVEKLKTQLEDLKKVVENFQSFVKN